MKIHVLISLLILFTLFVSCDQQTEQRPNILWITTEDISPHLGCYGEGYAHTPALDKLADDGVLFRNAFATASVCTPARSSIITGLYASTLGTQHLRGNVPLSKQVQCFTAYLRASGYYCANFNKTDYNFDVPDNAWDHHGQITHDSLVSEFIAGIPDEKPFFCVFNFSLTHQSQTRYNLNQLEEKNSSLSPEARHDPELAPIPPYYPDTREVRTNLAALHTQITLMDGYVNEILRQLEVCGMSENTIVFFFSDHGDGLPRHKRWLYHSGIQVPFIIRFPEKFRHLTSIQAGEETDILINFTDLAPTILSIAECEIPGNLPGYAFLGPHAVERQLSFAIRDRVDEVYEFSRSVGDGRYQYIRNFAFGKPRMQWSNYSELTPIRKELRRLHAKGDLDPQTSWLMQESKPIEEFYDVAADPHQMNNLASDPDYRERMERMRQALFEWMIRTHDLSLIPEPLMREVSKQHSPMDIFAGNDLYPIREILDMADRVGRGVGYLEDMTAGLSHPSPAVRYWAARGLSKLKEGALPAWLPLQNLLYDDVGVVRIAAAEALCGIRPGSDAIRILREELLSENILLRLYAAISILELEMIPESLVDKIQKARDMEPINIPDKNYVTYLENALQRMDMKIQGADGE